MAEQILEVGESLDADERVGAAVRNIRSAGVDERAPVPVNEIIKVDIRAAGKKSLGAISCADASPALPSSIAAPAVSNGQAVGRRSPLDIGIFSLSNRHCAPTLRRSSSHPVNPGGRIAEGRAQ